MLRVSRRLTCQVTRLLPCVRGFIVFHVCGAGVDLASTYVGAACFGIDSFTMCRRSDVDLCRPPRRRHPRRVDGGSAVVSCCGVQWQHRECIVLALVSRRFMYMFICTVIDVCLDVSMYGLAPFVVEFQGCRRCPRHRGETVRRPFQPTLRITAPMRLSLTSRLDRRSAPLQPHVVTNRLRVHRPFDLRCCHGAAAAWVLGFSADIGYTGCVAWPQ